MTRTSRHVPARRARQRLSLSRSNRHSSQDRKWKKSAKARITQMRRLAVTDKKGEGRKDTPKGDKPNSEPQFPRPTMQSIQGSIESKDEKTLNLSREPRKKK